MHIKGVILTCHGAGQGRRLFSSNCFNKLKSQGQLCEMSLSCSLQSTNENNDARISSLSAAYCAWQPRGNRCGRQPRAAGHKVISACEQRWQRPAREKHPELLRFLSGFVLVYLVAQINGTRGRFVDRSLPEEADILLGRAVPARATDAA